MLKRLGLLALLVLNSPLFAAEGFIWEDKVAIPTEVLETHGGMEGLKRAFLANAESEGLRPDTYPAEVLAEARAFQRKPSDTENLDEQHFRGLVDLTKDIPFITIDNDYSRDLDQAVAVQQLQDGSFILYYAIADASYFVRERDGLDPKVWTLDRWARNQVFSTYMPGVDIPVLPRVLSEGLCSLSANKDRRAIVARIVLNRAGVVQQTSFIHAKVRSRAQQSYRTVQEFYDLNPEGEAVSEDYAAWREYVDSLLALRKLGKELVKQADRRRVLRFPERDLRLFQEEGTYYIATYKRFEVEMWNEQVSVTTNHEVGKFIRSAGQLSVHRYHRGPIAKCAHHRRPHEKKCLECLEKKLMYMDYDSYTQLSNFASKLDEDNPRDRAALGMICQTNHLAEYSASMSGHYGLHFEDDYDPFTAPMRRYTDIVNHRVLLKIMQQRSDEASRAAASAGDTDEEEAASASAASSKWVKADSQKDDEGAYLDEGGPVYERARGKQAPESSLEEVARLANTADEKRGKVDKLNQALLVSLVLRAKVGQELLGTVSHLDHANMRVKLSGMPFTLTLRAEELREQGGLNYRLAENQISATLKPRRGTEYNLALGDTLTLKVLSVTREHRVIALPVLQEQAEVGDQDDALEPAQHPAKKERSYKHGGKGKHSKKYDGIRLRKASRDL